MRLVALATLVACGETAPAVTEGATGVLDADSICWAFVDEGYATFDLGGWALEVTLPPYPDLWGHELAFLARSEGDCRWDVGEGFARVQLRGEPADGHRAVFVEGLDFPPSRACSTCDPADCIDFAGARADRIYRWCVEP